MENDSQAIAIGLGAGLGGFAGFIIIVCILWHIFCGSWCETKKVQSAIAPIPKKQRKHPTDSLKAHSNLTTVTSVNANNVYPDLKSNASNNQSLLEIRFHSLNQFCLLEENILYDNKTIARKRDEQYYDIKCFSEKYNNACRNFTQQISAFCQRINEKSGYAIFKRQFVFIVERLKPLNLYYSGCCWSNSSNKNYYFNLSIETDLTRINSSPYPYIPASYYVAFNKSNTIKIFAYDADGDEILCEPYEEDVSGFLTVYVDNDCKLNYKIDQFGEQYGQFWLMDRYQNRILSRSLISIQVHVLENVVCDNQPELIIQRTDNIIKLNESIDVSVRLHPNCHLIKHDDQTITEITTLCTNNQSISLANGGIEVLFQCQFNLCDMYHICFVGEIGLKLPATDIQCFSIEVTGSENECTKAANGYDFDAARHRHFIKAEPIFEKLITIKSSQSARWLWVFLAHLAFLLAGIIIYCGCKQLLLLFYNRSFRKRSMTESHPIVARRSTIPTEPLLHNYDHVASKKGKVRTQYLRLGSVDNPIKKN